MTSKLPINLDNLLRQRQVEGERIEYKAGWNPDAILRTLCAFANDFENLGGGYVVIGQDCDANGRPVFPPAGVPEDQLDKIQRELLGFCNLIHLKELDLTEGRSTGISKIIKAMAANGSPAPEFETDDDHSYFLIRLPVHEKAAAWAEGLESTAGETTQKTTQETTQKTSVKTSVKILEILRRNPELTLADVAEEIGLTRRAIEMASSKLVKEGHLKYVGPQKGGHWEVTGK
ncbi:MAG: winged helix-turn-helix transcriptional regulator [Candidatus Paceibacterota bacterium]|jgi:predicted HTH transcriptional regulator